MDPTDKPMVKPVWAKRRAVVEAKNDKAFTEMRTNQGRQAPVQWSQPPPKWHNYSGKERPAAGHTRNNTFQPRTEVRRVRMTGERKEVAEERATGVTKEDRAMARTDNERFFDAAKSQAIIEKHRTGKK